jgi:putative DNA primase/helicase
LFSANELPATADNTDGFFRRWIIIPFPNTFPPGKRDVRLLGKLTSPEELSGALNLALEGLRRLYKQGRFSVSETINDQLQDYRLRSDPVAAFVAECCVLEKFAIISKAELYNAYRNWTYDTGSKAMSQKRFGPLIRNIEGVDETRDSGTRSWVGIGLKGVKSNLRALK